MQDYIEDKSRSEVLEVVSKMGGWPVLGDAFDPEQFVWYELMGEFILFTVRSVHKKHNKLVHLL